MSSEADQGISFPSLPGLSIPRSCSLDPAFYALEWLLGWKADVQVGETTHRDTPVFPLLRKIRRDPAAYGVSATQVEAAVERFMQQAAPALELEGGQRAWLEQELER